MANPGVLDPPTNAQPPSTPAGSSPPAAGAGRAPGRGAVGANRSAGDEKSRWPTHKWWAALVAYVTPNDGSIGGVKRRKIKSKSPAG